MSGATTNHTPGPWKVGENVLGALAVGAKRGREITAIDEVVADVRVRPAISEAVANARLIASAPDLLEALERIATEPCGCDEPEDGESGVIECNGCIARAALSKARGE